MAVQINMGLGLLILRPLVSRCQLIGSAIDPEDGCSGSEGPQPARSAGDMGQLSRPEG